MNQEYVSVAEAAEYVGVSTKTIRRWISAGHLRAFRTGPRLLRLRLNDVDAMVTGAPIGGA